MSDLFDKAQERDQEFLALALNNHHAARRNMIQEQPDEDEEGNRYCLSCGSEIPKKRIEAQPEAVRCVSCQSRKEPH
nr:TraR/DksA C4-type zinc finger protein [Vibrio mimicus]